MTEVESLRIAIATFDEGINRDSRALRTLRDQRRDLQRRLDLELGTKFVTVARCIVGQGGMMEHPHIEAYGLRPEKQIHAVGLRVSLSRDGTEAEFETRFSEGNVIIPLVYGNAPVSFFAQYKEDDEVYTYSYHIMVHESRATAELYVAQNRAATVNPTST